MSEGAVDVSTPGEGAGTSIPVVADPGGSTAADGSILSTPSTAEPGTEGTVLPVVSEPATTIPHWSDNFASIDLKSNPLVKGFDNAEAMAAEHLNLQGLIGRKGVIRPAEDAPPSHWEKYYNDLGRPATPGEYKLDGFTRPEGVGWDVDGVETPMVAVMHEAGLSNEQVEKVLQGYGAISTDFAQRGSADVEAVVDATHAALKTDWGLAFEAKVDLAIRAANKNIEGGAKTLEGIVLADGTTLADNPVMIRLLSKMGEISQEAGLIGEGNHTVHTLTPVEATDKYKRHEHEFRDALLDAAHPDHKLAVDERMRLRSAMNG